MVKLLRDHQTQHAIAQEFEPLIRSRSVSACMHQRAHQEGGVAEFVTEPLLKPGEACGGVSQFR